MVDFFSPTCGSCQMMMPVVDALAQKYVNKFRIATFFNIRGVPSFYFFNGGSLIDQLSGAVSEGVLGQKLSNLT